MTAIIARLITPQFDYPDPADQQRAHRVLAINTTWAILVGIAALFATWIFDHLTDANSIWLLVATFAGVLVVHQLVQRGQLQFAARLLVLNLLAGVLFTLLPNYRIDTPLILALIAPVVAAGALLRRVEQFGLMLALVILVGIVAIAQGVNDMAISSLGDATDSLRATALLASGLLIFVTITLWVLRNHFDLLWEREHRLQQYVDIVHTFSAELARLPAPGEPLNAAIETLRDAFGLYHAQVFLVDSASGMATLKASTGYLGRRLLEEESLLSPDEQNPVNTVLRHPQPLLILENAPESDRQGFLPGTQNELLLPLRVGASTMIGVLDLHSAALDTFDPNTRQILIGLANHLASTLYANQQAQQAFSAAQERDQAAAQLDTRQRELDRINRQLIDTTWGQYLHNQAEDITGVGWHHNRLTPVPGESDVLAQTLQDGQVRREQMDTAHVLCVPIRLRGQILGAIEFRRSSRTGWSTAAQELAEAVADRLALSLENARLFEQTQITAQREQMVAQITADLQSTTDLEALMTVAAARFQDALGANQTRVRLGGSPSSVSAPPEAAPNGASDADTQE